MKELTQHEVDLISGADIKGMIWGVMDGALTGIAIGGKWAGAGGIGFGAVAQLVGAIVGPIMGATASGIIGLMYGTETVAKFAAHYRETLGPGNVGHSSL